MGGKGGAPAGTVKLVHQFSRIGIICERRVHHENCKISDHMICHTAITPMAPFTRIQIPL